MKETDAALPRQLRKYLLPVARMVASGAAAKVERDSGAAAGSLSASAGQSGASVLFGGSKAPYYPWLDFGGSVGRGHQPGHPWSGSVRRDFITGGRYVYPTIEANREEIEQAALEAVTRAARDADLEVV